MSHTIDALNIDGLGISDETLIGYIENELSEEVLKDLGIERIVPAKMGEYLLSDFGVLEKYFDENLAITLTPKEIQRLVLKRFLQAEIMLYSCLNADETGLMNLILNKHKIIRLIDEFSDTMFVLPVMKNQENTLGLGALIDKLYVLSVATRKEVKMRLIRGYKYYE